MAGNERLKQFALPGVAGGLAVCATHPLELTKVRLQLDSELAARGERRLYGGWLDCVRQSWRGGGAANLWCGLSFGVAREVVFNCARIASLLGEVAAALGRRRAPLDPWRRPAP